MHVAPASTRVRNPAHIDGRTALIFRGEAESVRFLTFMPRFQTPIDFVRIDGPEESYWALVLDLPDDARIEYRLEVRSAEGVAVVLDPMNAHVATNPFGSNSVAVGPRYRTPWWQGQEAPSGSMREIRVTSSVLGSRRHHHVYTPHGKSAVDPLPLLVVHDGSDYFDHAGLGACLDVLIQAGTIPPIRVLLFDPVRRNREYVGNALHARHLALEVLPHLERRFRVTTKPIVMGASLGAVAAWHAVWTYPERYGGLFLQSGTFAFENSPFMDDDMGTSIRAFLDDAEAHTRLQGRNVVLTCGRYESLIDWNRTVADRLTGEANLRYIERWAGHDWGAWADGFEEGFVHLFGRSLELPGSGSQAPI